MWFDSSEPVLLLAPMDGYTDSPFRQMVKEIAPEVVVFTEFISARELTHCKAGRYNRYLSFVPKEEPLIVQLYGKEPEEFQTAARIAQDLGAAGIDINMGCPSKKVVAHSHGSALMQDIGLACRIIEHVKSAVTIPVTVKTRLGWEHHRDLISFALKLQDAGLNGITVHGRTYAQKFEGSANWNPIYELKNKLRIPVFGNGDITTPEQAIVSRKNLNGIMVGRAAAMDPWLMKRIAYAFFGNPSEIPRKTSFTLKIPFWLNYLERTARQRGELAACRRFRRYLVFMVSDMNLPAEMRKAATKVESISEVEKVMKEFSRFTI